MSHGFALHSYAKTMAKYVNTHGLTLTPCKALTKKPNYFHLHHVSFTSKTWTANFHARLSCKTILNWHLKKIRTSLLVHLNQTHAALVCFTQKKEKGALNTQRDPNISKVTPRTSNNLFFYQMFILMMPI